MGVDLFQRRISSALRGQDGEWELGRLNEITTEDNVECSVGS